MLIRKYHSDNVKDFLSKLRDESYVVLGHAIIVESDEPIQEPWEWPTEDDRFYFFVGFSIDCPE